jgi:glycosyltransferase involved in cell wall biosynthesis
MPNYNKSEHISFAIESAQAQTFPGFELLVVDDASTDESTKIIEEYSRSDPRVLLVRQSVRRSVSYNRNVGIKLSRGTVISFLDSDDICAPTKLEIQYRALRDASTPVVVYSDCWLLDGSGKRLPHWPGKFCTMRGMIFKEYLTLGMPAETTLMLPKEFFNKVGLFDESVTWGEDTNMILRLAGNYPFKYLDKQLYGYRQHPGNTWNKMSNRQRLASKTPILEKHFRTNIRNLDETTRKTVRERHIKGYFESHQYGKAMSHSVASPVLFRLYLSLVWKKLF